MLPEAILWLVNAALVLAESRLQLPLNSVLSFSPQNSSDSLFFSLPPAQNLSISVALCSGTIGSSSARFFVTNSSTVVDPGPDGGTDVFEILTEGGLGIFSGPFNAGGVLAVDSAASIPFQVGASDSGPIYEILDDLPLLGDTTSNQAILFSPPFDPPLVSGPTYPNYTLSLPSTSLPSPPSSSPNFSLILAPTLSQNLTTMQQTACMISGQPSSGTIANESLWLRDFDGWRTQWLVSGLVPSTNYTVYVVQDDRKLSGPIYFTTKSASFSCPLAASLPYCPGVSYAVPLPHPDSELSVYDSTNIPPSISDPLQKYFSNFTTTLTTFACGRDYYSPLKTCADCQREYFKWLCTISFPRCGEENSAITSTSSTAASTATTAPQQIFSALQPQSTTASPRNPNFPSLNMSYTVLLPCIEVCQAVDRACPYFLGFTCPLAQFSSSTSYGVGYIDGALPDQEGLGTTGTAQDRFGNIWCNSL